MTQAEQEEQPDLPDQIEAVWTNDQPVDAEPEDVVEVAVWVCIQCFDGNIRFPLVRDGKWQDQGIDLFYETPRVKKLHRCTFANLPVGAKEQDMKLAFARLTHPRGQWFAKKLSLPLDIQQQLMAQPWISPGPATTDRLR